MQERGEGVQQLSGKMIGHYRHYSFFFIFHVISSDKEALMLYADEKTDA